MRHKTQYKAQITAFPSQQIKKNKLIKKKSHMSFFFFVCAILRCKKNYISSTELEAKTVTSI